jgi:hypothetical protein
MSTLLNQFYEPKIQLVDQFVMAYGGIRGAVCYGLVVSWQRYVQPLLIAFIVCV